MDPCSQWEISHLPNTVFAEVSSFGSGFVGDRIPCIVTISVTGLASLGVLSLSGITGLFGSVVQELQCGSSWSLPSLRTAVPVSLPALYLTVVSVCVHGSASPTGRNGTVWVLVRHNVIRGAEDNDFSFQSHFLYLVYILVEGALCVSARRFCRSGMKVVLPASSDLCRLTHNTVLKHLYLENIWRHSL